MDNEYLIDRQTLGKFIDELIKKKPLAVENTEELNKLREESIKALDDKITKAIFGSLTKEQDEKLNQLLDHDEDADYQEFFSENNINIQEIVKNSMQEFADEFLGGQDV